MVAQSGIKIKHNALRIADVVNDFGEGFGFLHICMIAQIQGFVKCFVTLVLVAHSITNWTQFVIVLYSVVVHEFVQC